VNGIREFAKARGATATYVPIVLPEMCVDQADLDRGFASARPGGRNLFAYPAQSNFSGVQHPLEWIARAHEAGWDVLLDAAAFTATNRLDLSAWAPDFVVQSFYKLFGYPTGVGALVARRAALVELRRPWFAGGTVDYVSVQHGIHRARADAEGFEDGTPNFASIDALGDGFALLGEVGATRIAAHVERLTSILLDGLLALRHHDGGPLVRVYGPTGMRERGGTIAFNVLRADDRPVPYARVEAMAREMGVAVRGGCFCNPGAAEAAFDFDADTTSRCFRALDHDFSVEAFAHCLGEDTAVGAVRASVGLATSDDDVRRLLAVVERFAE